MAAAFVLRRCLQHFNGNIRTLCKASVAGQEDRHGDLDGCGIVQGVGCFEVVLRSQLSCPFNYRRAQFGHDKFNSGEEHIELDHRGEITPQRCYFGCSP